MPTFTSSRHSTESPSQSHQAKKKKEKAPKLTGKKTTSIHDAMMLYVENLKEPTQKN